jgi:Bacterial protein of unknown function (DUF899)
VQPRNRHGDLSAQDGFLASIKKELLMKASSPALCHLHFPGESVEYRGARNALLAEEMELRRQIERVAAQRRALPAGKPI